MTRSFYRGWSVLAGLSVMFCIAMALPIYGASVINTYMAADLHWNRQALGSLISIHVISNCVLSPLAAFSVNRIGIRGTTVLGCMLMIAGGLAMATIVSQPWQAVAASAVMGTVSALSGTVPCQSGVGAWFVRHRTMAISILYTVMGLGSFVSVLLINAAIVATGRWRSGWWVFVVAGILGVIVSLLLLRNEPTGEDARSEELRSDLARGSPSTRQYTLIEALRSPLLWTICFAVLALNGGNSFIVAHAQSYLRGMHFTPTAAASAMSLASVGMVIGNLGFGILALKLELRRACMLALGIFCLGLVMLANVQGQTSAVACALVAGIGFGAGMVGVMSMLGHYWGTRVYPALSAMGLIALSLGAGSVPIGAGIYFDAHQSYRPVIYCLAAISMVALLLFAITGTPHPARLAAEPRAAA